MHLQPLTEADADAAARLFVDARRRATALPDPADDAARVAVRLAGLLRDFPGIAAVDAGALCGYLVGFALPEFLGARRGVYCPEWAHAAVGPQRGETYRRMYAALSRPWADDGCRTHAVTLFSHDADACDAWFRSGFGLNGVDAVRDLTPLGAAAPPGLEIVRATPGDADRLVPLLHALSRHLADAPIFVAPDDPERADDLAAWLASPDHALWFAHRDGRPVAFLRGQTADNEQRHVISGADGVAISGAYTDPAWRGAGVGSALLDCLLAWARERGGSRCSVDFESQNIEADRFWRRHFTPVCYSLLRRIGGVG